MGKKTCSNWLTCDKKLCHYFIDSSDDSEICYIIFDKFTLQVKGK